jgi:hypothetical protein
VYGLNEGGIHGEEWSLIGAVYTGRLDEECATHFFIHKTQFSHCKIKQTNKFVLGCHIVHSDVALIRLLFVVFFFTSSSWCGSRRQR